MKVKVTALVAPALLLLATTAFGQQRDVRSQFYEFGNHVVDGAIRSPAALRVDGRPKAEFDRLATLKRSFLPEVLASGSDRALAGGR